MKTVLVLASIPVLLYGAIVVFFAVAQRRLQYFPSHQDAAGKGTATFVPWLGTDGALAGYVHAANSTNRLLLFFHGNGGEAIHRDWVKEITSPRTTIVLVEYPGYGGRAGEPTETAIEAAALAAYDQLVAKMPSLPVTVMGESLGTGVAAYVASQRKIDRLALVSPYTSITAVAAMHYPWLPVRWVLRDRYPSVERLAAVRVPLHVVHGTVDDIIPLPFAQQLVDGYGGPDKALTLLDGVGHNDIANALMRRPEAEPFRRFLQSP